MDDSLIDDENIPLDRRSLLPGEGFFIPDSLDVGRNSEEIRSEIKDSNRLVIADADADGLGCVALIQVARDGADFLSANPYELHTILDDVAATAHSDLEVFVCDLCPDSLDILETIESLAVNAKSIHWFDHHQWDQSIEEAIGQHATLVIGDSETECSADVTLRSLEYGFSDKYFELAAVIRDHDLWIREDPRSDDIADYAYWAEPEEFVETIRKYGASLPPAVLEFLEERRIEKQALIEKAVNRASFEYIEDLKIGVTYGRCSQNEVAEALREAGADASVVIKPSGSASIRGTDSFDRCHEVASQVNGGGHPKAAGCKPDIYDDMLDYAHHWTTRGAVAKQVILDAFRRLPSDTN